MPKRISTRTTDANQIAAAVVALATEIDPDTRSRVMAEMGRKGGRIGGKRRLETLSARRRKAIARKAAKARWNGSAH